MKNLYFSLMLATAFAVQPSFAEKSAHCECSKTECSCERCNADECECKSCEVKDCDCEKCSLEN